MPLEETAGKRGPIPLVCIGELVPQNHLLRKADRVMNWSFIYDLAKERYSPGSGRPSLDPAILRKILREENIAMTGKGLKNARFFLLLLFLFAAAQIGSANAAADDDLQKKLPGRWTYTSYADKESTDDKTTADLAFLTFEEKGEASLSCYDKEGKYLFACKGTWSLEVFQDKTDRLTIRYTSTDKPQSAEGAYAPECMYEAYVECWVENDAEISYLILTPVSCSGISPFQETYGEDWEVTLHREQGPNMRIARCKTFVSLREQPNKASRRLAKVPLRTLVLAYPQDGEKNGYIRCVYQDREGYILSKYLEPIE